MYHGVGSDVFSQTQVLGAFSLSQYRKSKSKTVWWRRTTTTMAIFNDPPMQLSADVWRMGVRVAPPEHSYPHNSRSCLSFLHWCMEQG